MLKVVILYVCCLFFPAAVVIAQLVSPGQYLGYEPGKRYTPHHKIVDYAKSVAAAKPDMVKFEQYGKTYEGRDLVLLYVSSPQNMLRLQEIRKNNLALTGMAKGVQPKVNEETPTIIWLSYNVHGNETSSSEAALKTLYALVDPANADTKRWLQHTVVIIDPCVNPDGRDRYVNWFNGQVGSNYNVDPQAREHNEPWPGGRTNHYNFDLNRDWAWQTQAETQQRMVVYNKWMPQIHVDFHEQGVSEPYYFAPAAEPLHDVITPWQRDFQKEIGKNNARYFDQNGWLYFTKERFDLFYPAYGDTYPTYNGAIGMTYEQGGGPRGGLGIVTSEGDTLTLTDRINHHYTTGLATIEVAAAHSHKLLKEFQKFFDDSRNNSASKVKSYVITSNNAGTMNRLAQLLTLNEITFGIPTITAVNGYDYSTASRAKGKLNKYSLAISTAQPKSVLARVLLEPHSHLVDSNTYDITAWSLPYVYNVQGYSVNEEVPVQPFVPFGDKKVVEPSAYGYLIRYNAISSIKVLAYLLKQGIKVRYTEKPLTYSDKVFERGTLIVLQRGNPASLYNILQSLNNEVEIVGVSTGFMQTGPDFGSPDVKVIEAPKVAVVTGEQVSALAAGEVWHWFDQQIDYPVTLVNASDLSRINLGKYTDLVFPNGNYRLLSDKNFLIRLKDYVTNGGNVIALEGAVEQLAGAEWGLAPKKEIKDDKTQAPYDLVKRYENRERDDLVNAIPGAIYKIELDNSHPLAFGYGNTYYALKQDARVYEFLNDGWNVGVLKKNNYVSGFAGSKVKEQLKDGLVLGVQPMGRGTVVYMADNPLFRQFWEGGKLLFGNAVFLVGQ